MILSAFRVRSICAQVLYLCPTYVVSVGYCHQINCLSKNPQNPQWHRATSQVSCIRKG
jgi:hypothetical protein